MEECKYCFKSIETGATILDLIVNRDVICPCCRKSFKRNKKKFYINKIRVNYFYIYDEFFSAILVQYKECMDEALWDVFLYPYRWIIKLKYNRYTLVPIPSSEEKLEVRGFQHVSKMFSNMNLKQCDCLMKTSKKKQALLTKKEREEMKEHIQCKVGVEIPRKVLLVDDVCTTGNTLKGAIQALSSSNCKIKILVVAIHPLNLK